MNFLMYLWGVCVCVRACVYHILHKAQLKCSSARGKKKKTTFLGLLSLLEHESQGKEFCIIYLHVPITRPVPNKELVLRIWLSKWMTESKNPMETGNKHYPPFTRRKIGDLLALIKVYGQFWVKNMTICVVNRCFNTMQALFSWFY